MIDFLYFAIKMIALIFGMKYFSDIVVAFLTSKKRKSIFDTSYFRDEEK